MQVHYAGRRTTVTSRLWNEPTGVGRALLTGLVPAELLFRIGSRIHHLRYDHGLARSATAAVPVISIGNLSVGGTGKTPITRWLVELLKDEGRRPAVLHGGYGLDEPALHRSWYPDVPVVVQRDRVAGAATALEQGADVLLLDDGFQHRRLRRDLDIVLIAADHWTAQQRRLPRGPWREGIGALRRAGVVVVTRKAAAARTADNLADMLADRSGRPAAVARLEPGGWRTPENPEDGAVAHLGDSVVLVTAVADWRSVATHAEHAGARIDEALVFNDHHDFDAADAERIRRFAGSRPVVCTEKDWVKLRSLLPAPLLRVLTLRVRFERGEDLLRAAVRYTIER
jgi:tetraacyldisaccharide 4'-kinase